MPLHTVKPNIVQSIRAFRVSDLQEAAQALGHHFLYVNLAQAQSKQDILDIISKEFNLAASASKNFDSLYDGMTDPLHKSGPQPGFILVLEHIPAHAKFDKEAREQLLDIFREAADYWSDRKSPSAAFTPTPLRVCRLLRKLAYRPMASSCWKRAKKCRPTSWWTCPPWLCA